MEEKDKFEANKKSNAPFLRALGVLMKEKNLNQAQAADLLNTKSGTFSDYKNGKKRASQEMFERLARAFGGRLNIRYLTGESEYMMLANVPDEEMIEYTMRDSNPDYDVQKKAKSTPQVIPSSLERSFLIEKEVGNTKSYLDKYIASLESQLKEKDELIADKQKLINMLENRVAELESVQQYSDGEDFIRRHPFPIGSAEPGHNEQERVNV